jgi:glycosyltransferase involved in cell wall biosynthesis
MDLSKGSTVHVKEVVDALGAMGCEVTLIASGNPQGDSSQVFISLQKRPLSRTGIRRLLTVLRELIQVFLLSCFYLPSHDLVYARDYHVALMCLLPKMLVKRRLVYEINGLASEEWMMKNATVPYRAVAVIIRGLEGLAARGADRVVAVTEGLTQYLVSNLHVDEKKIAVVPNGVDIKEFCPIGESESLEELRAILGIREEFVVLFVGNLAPWQGIDTLLDSVPLVLKEVPQVKFVIVGEGILLKNLQGKARAMSLESRVLFTGMVSHDRVPSYINVADVCVAPFVKRRNNRIGLSPLKVYEYMACGKAVVTSRVPGLEIVEEGETGFLVDPEDPRSLADGIIELLLDPKKRAHMGQRGLSLVREGFDWEKRGREVLNAVIEN